MKLVVRVLQWVQGHMTSAALLCGALMGLGLGLAVAWGLWPVQLVNSTPADLHSDFQQIYVLCVADRYAVSGDLEQAWAELGATHWDEGQLAAVLDQLANESGPSEALRLRILAQALGEPVPTPGGTETPAPDGPAPDEEGGSGFHTVTLLCGAGFLLVALAAGVAFLLPRLRRGRADHDDEDYYGPEPSIGELAQRLPSRAVQAEPTAQFVTTYALGDDQYDPSFTIESDGGDFVGECGVGMSETIGVGSPSKATAFEVWLFDKNDIRTVTAVVMSEYAFRDGTLRTELSAKGEPVEAKVGMELTLETKTLQLHVRIAEVEYGAGPLPQSSYFSRLTVELSPAVKGELDAAKVETAPLTPRF